MERRLHLLFGYRYYKFDIYLRPLLERIAYDAYNPGMTRQSTSPHPENIPVPIPGFTLEELDDELLLFNPHDGNLLELNSTAALVWQLCDGSRRISQIIEILSAAYPEAEASIDSDVTQILSNLAGLGAISWK
jgi:hypothetical protein